MPRPSRLGCAVSLVTALLAAPPASAAMAPDAEVLAVVERYERAVRMGDAALYCELQVAAERGGRLCRELKRDGFPPRPAFRLIREGVLLRTRTAAVFTRVDQRGETQHTAFVLAREGAAWRIQRQEHSSTPPHRPAVCPPEGGRFLAAGQPWDQVPAHPVEPGGPGRGAQVQVASDEAFLYVRFTSPADLPPPGALIADPSAPGLPYLPRIGIRVAAAGAPRRYSAEMTTGVGSRLAGGQRSAHLSYSMSLGDDRLIYFTFAGPDNPLFEVGPRHAVGRIPLESLGADEKAAIAVELAPAGAVTPRRY